MNRRQALKIRTGILLGRWHVELAQYTRAGYYPIRRRDASALEWEATTRTVQRRLPLLSGWTVTAGRERLTVRRWDQPLPHFRPRTPATLKG